MEWIAMRQGLSRGFTAAEKTGLWDRWQRGATLKAIGRAFGRDHRPYIFNWPRMVGSVLRPVVGRDWH